MATVEKFHPSNQVGFVRGKSTLDKGHNIRWPGKYKAAVFLDIKGAFDNAWWSAALILLKNKYITEDFLKIMAKLF